MASKKSAAPARVLGGMTVGGKQKPKPVGMGDVRMKDEKGMREMYEKGKQRRKDLQTRGNRMA